MLRRFMEWQMSLVADGKPLAALRPLIAAGDTFLYEAPLNTKTAPHIRDAVDVKRWMLLVVIALLPCTLMAIWNSGVQTLVFQHGDTQLLLDYIKASTSFANYKDFASQHVASILQYGLMAFLPVCIISYAVGGMAEAVSAIIKKKDIEEGFLVTGLLFPLVLPSTIPYWMVAIGVFFGVVVGKELFGGTGMNIMNPALTCRAFLFFAYPGAMSGDVWVGTNPVAVSDNLAKINEGLVAKGLDGYSMASAAKVFHAAPEIQRIHIDAIAAAAGHATRTFDSVLLRFSEYLTAKGTELTASYREMYHALSSNQIRDFVTDQAGLALDPQHFEAAKQFVLLEQGAYTFSDGNLFFGNMIGSMGETSTFACLLGAAFLLAVGVASWRTMAGVLVGSIGLAAFFQYATPFWLSFGVAYSPAIYTFPAYKHLLMGSLAFGLVFMATDPVSSPSMPRAKWWYGILIGALVVIIRTINPAFPEGVMLAILLGNVAAPLLDYYAVRTYRRPCGAN